MSTFYTIFRYISISVVPKIVYIRLYVIHILPFAFHIRSHDDDDTLITFHSKRTTKGHHFLLPFPISPPNSFHYIALPRVFNTTFVPFIFVAASLPSLFRLNTSAPPPPPNKTSVPAPRYASRPQPTSSCHFPSRSFLQCH